MYIYIYINKYIYIYICIYSFFMHHLFIYPSTIDASVPICDMHAGLWCFPHRVIHAVLPKCGMTES